MDKTMTCRVCLLICSLLSVSLVNGQQVFQSLEEVWSYALKNNPENALYGLQVEKAVSDQKTASSALYPKIKGGISGQHNVSIAETPIPGEILGRPGEIEYVQFGLPFVYQANITLTKTLIDWQSIYQSKIAKTNTQLIKAEKLFYEQTLKEQVAQVYYATLTAQAVVQIAEKDLLLADSILMITSNRFQEGLIDVLTLNQARINRNSAFERLEQNRSYLYDNGLTLKSILGSTVGDSLVLREQIQITGTDLLSTVPTNELSIKRYEIQVEMTDLERRKALSNYSPKLDFISSWGKIQYQENFTFSLNSSDWQSNSYLGLNLSIPIFLGLANKHQLNSAKTANRIARLNYEEELRKSSITDKKLWSNYQSAYTLALSTRQSLQISAENVQLAYQKYSEGLISLDGYLAIFDDYLNVENQYFSRLSDYLVNKATIVSRNK